VKFVLVEDCTINEISRGRIVPEVGGRWEKAELEVGGKAGRLGLFDSVSWNLPSSALRDSETTSESAVWLAASGGWLVDREASLMTSAPPRISLGDLGSFWPSEAPMVCSKGRTSPNVEDV
jgi:hypothetical protein